MEILESKNRSNITILRGIGGCKMIREEWTKTNKKKIDSCSDKKIHKIIESIKL